ncbi:Uncharacterised protein [Bordetella pertussis]|nr:Uncharacterised protein [Bordetella pertussis]CPQ82686.1 Uncharacterised protein [Bordetella pertussis]
MSRVGKAPFSSRQATMFLASSVFSPETRASSAAEAVLTSTPTAFTQSSTTASSERASSRWLTSCWYWPTPIALGSILTSSAKGSCRRRAIETAPRSVTSRSGNSSAAVSEAEYTEAPASETTTRVNARSGKRAIMSPTSFSDSREAVPLPMAMSSTLWRAARAASVLMVPSRSRRGSNG